MCGWVGGVGGGPQTNALQSAKMDLVTCICIEVRFYFLVYFVKVIE